MNQPGFPHALRTWGKACSPDRGPRPSDPPIGGHTYRALRAAPRVVREAA